MNFNNFHGFFTLIMMVLSIYQIEGKNNLLLKDKKINWLMILWYV